jgi:hypothetical protein
VVGVPPLDFRYLIADDLGQSGGGVPPSTYSTYAAPNLLTALGLTRCAYFHIQYIRSTYAVKSFVCNTSSHTQLSPFVCNTQLDFTLIQTFRGQNLIVGSRGPVRRADLLVRLDKVRLLEVSEDGRHRLTVVGVT